MLIVEDNEMNRDMLARRLVRRGFEVVFAVDGEGGIEMLRSHRREVTVMLCDLRGFTLFAERAEPEDVMQVLSELHGALGPLVFEQGGTLAQFTGDRRAGAHFAAHCDVAGGPGQSHAARRDRIQGHRQARADVGGAGALAIVPGSGTGMFSQAQSIRVTSTAEHPLP